MNKTEMLIIKWEKTGMLENVKDKAQSSLWLECESHKMIEKYHGRKMTSPPSLVLPNSFL